jgi:uncharacterized protein (TIGR00255 family)
MLRISLINYYPIVLRGRTMISSMTGFSAATIELETGSLALEIRSVNHRYLDLVLRFPDELRLLEPAFRDAISAFVTRGKVECRVSHTARALAGIPARINQQLLKQLAEWSDEVRNTLPAARELGVADILRWNGIFESNDLSDGKLQGKALDLLHQALTEFNAARAREGEKLKIFLLQRAGQVNALCTEIAPRIPAAIRAYESKLRTRLLDALDNHDDERVHQEISLYANRIDVDEELSRLQTHLTEIMRLLAQGGCVGKHLDFLMQELHREANTLGSKSVDAEVSRVSIEMKILIEQMREQIQNLE